MKRCAPLLALLLVACTGGPTAPRPSEKDTRPPLALHAVRMTTDCDEATVWEFAEARAGVWRGYGVFWPMAGQAYHDVQVDPVTTEHVFEITRWAPTTAGWRMTLTTGETLPLPCPEDSSA